MFSGIGGFERGIEQTYKGLCASNQRQGIQRVGNKEGSSEQCSYKRIPRFTCIGYSEIDKYASAIYRYHYPKHKNYGDATAINVSELPAFDLLVGGFPCQAFSIAGKRQGFKDTRGTLFFDVARILESKRPEWVVLENVKGLLNHDSGETVATIYEVLTELGYTVGWEVVNSCHFGVPQNRERIFIVGHLTAAGGRAGEVLPFGQAGEPTYQEQHVSTAIDANYWKGIDNHGQRTAIAVGTWRTHKDGQGFREVESGLAPTIPARAREDGSGQPVVALCDSGKGRELQERKETFPPLRANTGAGHGNYVVGESKIRRLTPIECERLQGFPDNWTQYGIIDGKEVKISDTQRYKALGNAVTVNVIEAIMSRIMQASTSRKAAYSS